jgi:hypothetical protein
VISAKHEFYELMQFNNGRLQDEYVPNTSTEKAYSLAQRICIDQIVSFVKSAAEYVYALL